MEGKTIRKAPAAVVAAALLTGAAGAQPANAPSEDATGVVLRSTQGEFSGRSTPATDPVAEVRPGETVTITGDCLGTPSAENLRVVLTFAERADASSGYRSVLATDQRIRDGNLQIRVPDLPDVQDQILQVMVYRLGTAAPQICGAGAIRIDAGADGKLG